MKARSKALAAGCATALVSILAPATASATGACYAFTHFNNETIQTYDGGPPLVLRYLHTSAGSINTDTEARQLKHLRQTAYSLVGKATLLIDDRCATTGPADCTTPVDDYPQVRLMTTIDGTIITGRQLSGYVSPDPPGAHMGINMHILRRFQGGYPEFAFGPVTLECTTPQPSPVPSTWLCNVRAELDVGYILFFEQFAINVPILLRKLPANTAPACSVFRDGELYVAPEA
jgi:hypothetical protein